MAEIELTDEELLEGHRKGTLTKDQYFLYLTRVKHWEPMLARMTVNRDWSRVEEDLKNQIVGH